MLYRKEEKVMLLKNWRRSGKTAWAYAKEIGICPQTFARWKKAKLVSKRELVEIPKSVIMASNREPEILIEKGELKIHLPFEPVWQELRAVMETLGQSL